jgi:hypothetical protein
MSGSTNPNKTKKLNLENYVVIEGRVYIMGDVSGAGTKYLPLSLPLKTEKKVLRLLQKLPDRDAIIARNNSRYIQNGSGYLFAPQVS